MHLWELLGLFYLLALNLLKELFLHYLFDIVEIEKIVTGFTLGKYRQDGAYHCFEAEGADALDYLDLLTGTPPSTFINLSHTHRYYKLNSLRSLKYTFDDKCVAKVNKVPARILQPSNIHKVNVLCRMLDKGWQECLGLRIRMPYFKNIQVLFLVYYKFCLIF